MGVKLPENEVIRLKSLRNLEILDTESDEAYDAITRLASNVMNVPVALISLIDEDRAWFKSKAGPFTTIDSPREHSFCAHAILTPDEPTIVIDARLDKRFSNNPAVIGDPNIRFYFGVPLITSDNQAIGALCAIDNKPHPNPTPSQITALQDLSKIVISQLELRKSILDVNKEVTKIENYDVGNFEEYRELYKQSDLILNKIKARKNPT